MNRTFDELFGKAIFASACFFSACYVAAYIYNCQFFDGMTQPRYLTAYIRSRLTREGNVITVPFKKETHNEPRQ